MVAYLKDFGEQAYFLNFPTKFISDDGKSLWLCYSANFSPGWNGAKLGINPPGGRYGLSLHELKVLGSDDQVAAKPNQYDQEVKRGFRWDTKAKIKELKEEKAERDREQGKNAKVD
jgi:hypothetical protein